MQSSSRRNTLPFHGTLALSLLLAGNEDLAQAAVQITLDSPALATPIPLWATGLLGLMLALLGYWALRARLPANLHRLRGWPLLAILSMASLAAVSSGVWVSRAYAGADTSISLVGIVTVDPGVVLDQDIPVNNSTGQAHTITSVTVSGFVPKDAAVPKVALLSDFILVPPTTHSPQCVAGLPIAASGIVCYVRVALTA